MIFRKRNGMKRLLAYCRALFCLGVAGIPLTTMDGPTGGAVDSGQDVAAFTDSSSQELPKPVLDQSFFTAGNLTVTSDAPGTYKIAGPDRVINNIPVGTPLEIINVTTTVTSPRGLIIDGVRGLVVRLENVGLVGNGCGGLDLRGNADVTLLLDGSSSLIGGSGGGYSYAGLQVTNSTGGSGDMSGASTVAIQDGPLPGTGSLTATGGDIGGVDLGAAGIGGGGIPSVGAAPSHCFAGIINIYSGNITSIGGSGAAGIGGGNGDYLSNTSAEKVDTGGRITISGGRVEAIANAGAAGIGGGYGGSAGVVSITGGVIKATGRTAGIGSGYAAAGGDISITGGHVKAYGTNPRGDVTGIGSYRSQFDPSIVLHYEPTRLNIGKSAILRAYSRGGENSYAITVDKDTNMGDALIQNNYFSPENRPNLNGDLAILTPGWPNSDITLPAEYYAFAYTAPNTAMRHRTSDNHIIISLDGSSEGAYLIPSRASDLYPGGAEPVEVKLSAGIPMNSSDFTRSVTKAQNMLDLSAASRVTAFASAAALTSSGELLDPAKGELIIGATTLIRVDIAGYTPPGITAGTYPVIFLGKRKEKVGDSVVRVDGTAVVRMTVLDDGYDGGSGVATSGEAASGTGIEARDFRIPLSRYAAMTADGELKRLALVAAWRWDDDEIHGYYPPGDVSVDKSNLKPEPGSCKISFRTREGDGGAVASVWATVYDDSKGGGVVIPPIDIEDPTSRGTAISAHSFKIKATATGGADLHELSGAAAWRWKQKDTASATVSPSYINVNPTALPATPGVYPLTFKIAPFDGCPPASIKVWAVVHDGPIEGGIEIDYTDPNDETSAGQAIFACSFTKTEDEAAELLSETSPPEALIREARVRAWTWTQGDASYAPSAAVTVMNDGIYRDEAGDYDIVYAVDIPGGKRIMKQARVMGIPPIVRIIDGSPFTVTQHQAMGILSSPTYVERLVFASAARISPDGDISGARIDGYIGGKIEVGTYLVVFSARFAEDFSVPMTVVADGKDGGGSGATPDNATKGSGIEAWNFRLPLSQFDMRASGDAALKAMAGVYAWHWEAGNPRTGDYLMAGIDVDRSGLIKAEGTYKLTFSTKESDGGATISVWATIYDDDEGGGAIVTPTDSKDGESKGTAVAAHSFNLRASDVGGANLKDLAGVSSWIWQQKDGSSIAINAFYVSTSPTVLPTEPGIYPLIFKAEPGNDYPEASVKVWVVVYDGKVGSSVEVDYPDPTDPSSTGQAIFAHDFLKTKGEAAAMLSATPAAKSFIEAAGAKAFTWCQSDESVFASAGVRVVSDGGFKADAGTYESISFAVNIPGGKTISVAGSVSAKTVVAHNFTVTRTRANTLLPEANHLAEIAGRAGAHVSPGGLINSAVIREVGEGMHVGIYPVTFEAEGTDDLTVFMTVTSDGKDSGNAGFDPIDPTKGTGIEARNYRIPLSRYDASLSDLRVLKDLAEVYAWRRESNRPNAGDYPLADVLASKLDLIRAEGTYKTVFATREGDGGATVSAWATVYDDSRGGGVIVTPTDPDEPLSKGTAMAAHSFRIRTGAVGSANLKYLADATAWIWQQKDTSSTAINDSYISVSPATLPSTPGIYALTFRAEPGNDYPAATIKVWAAVYEGADGGYIEVDYPDPTDPASEGHAIYVHNFVKTKGEAAAMLTADSISRAFISAAGGKSWLWSQGDTEVYESDDAIRVIGDGGFKAETGTYTPISFAVNIQGGKAIGVTGVVSARTLVGSDFTVTRSVASSFLPAASHLVEIREKAGARVSPEGEIRRVTIGGTGDPMLPGSYPVIFSADGTDDLVIRMTVTHDGVENGITAATGEGHGTGIEAKNYQIPLSRFDVTAHDAIALKNLASVYGWYWNEEAVNAGEYPLPDVAVDSGRLMRAEGTYKTRFATDKEHGGAQIAAWATVYNDSQGGGVSITPTDPKDPTSKGTAIAAHSFKIKSGSVGTADLRALTGAAAWIWQEKDTSSIAVSNNYVSVSPTVLPSTPGIYPLILRAEPGNGYPAAMIKVWAVVYDGKEGSYVEIDYPDPSNPASAGQVIYAHSFTRTTAQAMTMNRLTDLISAANALAWTWRQSDIKVSSPVNVKVDSDGGIRAEEGDYPIRYVVNMPGGKSITIHGTITGGHTAESKGWHER